MRTVADDEPNGASGPVDWQALTADEALEEWPELFEWVQRLRVRYPNGTRLPDCWWQHNDLVEVLSALRDHERGCFAPTAPATAAMEWQRALRDAEHRLETWIRRLPCSVPGRGHEPIPVARSQPEGWDDFVASDVQRRRELGGP